MWPRRPTAESLPFRSRGGGHAALREGTVGIIINTFRKRIQSCVCFYENGRHLEYELLMSTLDIRAGSEFIEHMTTLSGL
jgi:hypothetical protein